MHPADGHAVGVAVVEAGRDAVLDEVVERGRLHRVALGAVVRAVGRRDRPAVAAVEVLVPPAVEDRQVERAVERRLHAGRAARLERAQRVVEPHVGARVEQLRHADVVVGQEDEAAADPGLGREAHQLLDEALALVVRRVRLARDHDLHGPLRVGEDPAEPLPVVEHEREALVGRHAPGEADREDLGVEHVLEPRRLDGARVLLAPGAHDAAAGVLDELAAHPAAHVPEVAVGHGRRRPVGRSGVPRAEALARERHEHRIRPRRRVHAVRHARDRHLVGVEPRPEPGEHAAADLAVQLRDAVGALREAEAHERHVEDVGRSAVVGLGTEPEHALRRDARQQPLGHVLPDEPDVEPVDARGHGRVRREDRARAHHLERLVEVEAVGHEGGDPLDAEEARVALVGVEDARDGRTRDAGVRGDRAHAADAEQQLLVQAVLAAAAVQPVGDAAEVVVVLGHVGVEEEQRDAADARLPDPRVQGAVGGQLEGDVDGRAVGVAQDLERQSVGVEDGVGLLLPAVGGDPLAEVAGAVEEADAHERDAEVGGALQVVAREDPEAARVLRQRGRDPELGREVADRLGHVALQLLVPARLADVRAEVRPLLLGPCDEALVGRELPEPLLVDRAEQRHRIVARPLPQLGAHVREHAAGGLVPGPSEVPGELVQRGQLLREDGTDGESADGLHGTPSDRTAAGGPARMAPEPRAAGWQGTRVLPARGGSVDACRTDGEGRASGIRAAQATAAASDSRTAHGLRSNSDHTPGRTRSPPPPGARPCSAQGRQGPEAPGRPEAARAPPPADPGGARADVARARRGGARGPR
ncbi:hypothetical protein CMMCAS04_09015 [Clavibacter michiganensis subsp. michiganensis]|nr:hypothetical protein CMMCAS04_09015 [Clavibacter michiganensis subsp. michiganensis]